MARNIVRSNPFAELDALQKQFFEDGFLSSLRKADFPTTDVYLDDKQQLVVEAHPPHFTEKDISVDLDQGALVIQAQSHEKEEDKKKKYIVRETSTSFYRRVALPKQADVTNIAAQFVDGVLTVMVPIQKVAAPTKISISSGADAGGATIGQVTAAAADARVESSGTPAESPSGSDVEK